MSTRASVRVGAPLVGARPAQHQRGFTLLELMTALAIGSIVVGGLFGTMLMQQQSYMAQMELVEASQSARAALDIIKQSLRTAGWGMIAAAGAGGIPAVGTCYSASLADQSMCDDQPAMNPGTSTVLSDRMRLVGITPGSTFTRVTSDFSLSSNILVVTDPAQPPLQRQPLAVGDLAIISGQCNDTSGAVYNGVVKITNVRGGSNPGGALYSYQFDPVIAGYPPFTCTSVKDGFAFGKANIVEFYIDRSTVNPDKSAGSSPTVPQLRMITNRGGLDPFTGQAPVEQVVANDIENLQVRYGLDCGHVPLGQTCLNATSPAADDIIDLVAPGQQWCNDLQVINCNTGMSQLENQQRVMAVQVAVVPRTRELARRILNNETKTTKGPPVNVFGSIVPGDGYKRWVYRATVALRNNQLAITQ